VLINNINILQLFKSSQNIFSQSHKTYIYNKIKLKTNFYNLQISIVRVSMVLRIFIIIIIKYKNDLNNIGLIKILAIKVLVHKH